MKFKVEVEATFFAVFYGFDMVGIYSAYQLSQLPSWELDLYWGYSVVN